MREQETEDNNGECSRSVCLFPYLNDLHEDLVVAIVSFAAEAPFEQMPENHSQSSLTHTLPHVSRKFYSLSQKDCIWKQAIVRQVLKEPFLWLEGLKRIIGGTTQTSVEREGQQQEEESATDLVERVHTNLGGTTSTTYKSIYQTVVSKHLHFIGPVYCRTGTLTLGEPYAVDLSEPHDRLLIREVVADQPDEAKRGGRVRGNALFIHANRMPATTTPAVLVQVLRCELDDDGRADVLLLPCAHVWLEKLWVRSYSGHDLHYAQCLRMRKQVAHDVNRLARQEALVHVMDQLAQTMSDTDDETTYDDEEEDDDDDDGSLNSIIVSGD